MKQKFAALAAAGALFAMTGAAHAIAPAAAAGLVFLGHAAVGEASKANQQQPQAATVAPSTSVLGAGPTTVVTPIEGGVQVIQSETVVVPAGTGAINYDHDGDGVLNHNDRFPNDGTRS
ncbi:MAG TPA: hypothetical protein VHL79_01270 [Ramlibacter sp.]|nr:hypothetical protein [Ramlibacter sp.]